MTFHGDDKMEEESEAVILGGEVVEIGDGLQEEQMNTENKEQSLNNHDPVNHVCVSHPKRGTTANLPTKLFSKSLSRTDIEVGLSPPTRCLRFFPELEGKSAIEFQAIDPLGKPWSFKLSVRKGGIPLKPVINGQWLEFVMQRGIKMGDILTIYMQFNEVDEVQYSITVFRKMFNPFAYLPRGSFYRSGQRLENRMDV